MSEKETGNGEDQPVASKHCCMEAEPCLRAMALQAGAALSVLFGQHPHGPLLPTACAQGVRLAKNLLSPRIASYFFS